METPAPAASASVRARAARQREERVMQLREELARAGERSERYAEVIRYLVSNHIDRLDIIDEDVLDLLREVGVEW